MSDTQEKQPAFELSWLGGILAMVVMLAALAGWMAVNGGGWAIAGVSVLISLAAFASGSVLGFLFGVPRVLARASENGAAGGADNPPEMAGKRLLQSNTNLERISDWLTTMLVGVGLTQVVAVPGAISKFYGFLAESRIGCPASGACSAHVLAFTGSTLMVLGVLCGFLFMYLYTRLMLTGLFQKTEEDLGRLPTAQAKAVKEQAEALPSDEAKKIANKAQPSVKDALSVMFEALYRPDGYKDVIQIGKQLSSTGATGRGDYWFYLAAAYGQAHHAASSQEERAVLRQSVIDAASQAVQKNPSYRVQLWDLTRADSLDNDLQDFVDDPDFKRIVGKSAAS
jgi:hypothetical protein